MALGFRNGPRMNSPIELVALTPPPIDPVSEGGARPLWSVMIPTFNCAKFLRQTLESVLAQDPGPEKMQIEVVDDCSTKDDPEAVVRETGHGRVAFYRKPKNEGAILNFNTFIQRSRGQLIHILHGDDYVLPGFYPKLTGLAEKHSDISAFFVRCLIVDEAGGLDRISDRIPQLAQPTYSPGELFYRNEIRTPGIVIRRQFYEKHGGFIVPLVHVADWEMLVRAITLGGGVWLNELLAAYRSFASNDTGRLARTGENLRDFLRYARIMAARFDHFDSARFRAVVAQGANAQYHRFASAGDLEAARANYNVWCELNPWLRRCEFKVRRAWSRVKSVLLK